MNSRADTRTHHVGGRRQWRWTWVVAGVAMLGLVSAACSSGTAAADHATGDSRRVPASMAAALKPINSVNLRLDPVAGVGDLKGKTVLIVPITGVPFTAAMSALEGALGEAGIKTRICDGQGVPSTVNSCLAQAKSLDVAAVITLAVPYELLPSAYDDLIGAKIPVLAAFQDPGSKPAGKYLAYQPITPSLSKAMELSADYITWKSGGKGSVLHIGISDQPTINAVSNEATAYLKKVCPDCHVQQEDIGAGQVDQIPNLVSTFALKNPDATYILATNIDVDVDGIVAGLQRSNKTDIAFGGSGSGAGGGQAISQGSGRFVAMASYNFLAWQWADAALRLIAQQPAPEYPIVTRLFDSSNATGLTWTPKEAQTFDWFGHASFADTFKKSWGIS